MKHQAVKKFEADGPIFTPKLVLRGRIEDQKGSERGKDMNKYSITNQAGRQNDGTEVTVLPKVHRTAV